jgi:two-component system copper resistance phosphate regulon response regulator CusR
MRILLVEDSLPLCETLRQGLEEESFAVDVAHDGEQAEAMARWTAYDVIVLDVMLPRKDGFAVCSTLRAQGVDTPMIFLTARDTPADRVAGLNLGGDDYLVKPFVFDELLARIHALLRRGRNLRSPLLRVADLELNTVTHEVTRAGQPISLTSKEYAILEYFLYHPGKVISRSELSEHIWDEEFDSYSNLIDVYLGRLRRKIDDDHEPKLFETLRGAGYRLRAIDAPSPSPAPHLTEEPL